MVGVFISSGPYGYNKYDSIRDILLEENGNLPVGGNSDASISGNSDSMLVAM